MQTQETLFTPTEAAVVTGLPLKAVNNAIDRKTVRASQGSRAGRATRLLDLGALVSLTLERRLADRLGPELRREVFTAIAGAQRSFVSVDGGLLRIDLREPRRQLAEALRELRRARRMVAVDPEVVDGAPLFRGTRVPVHAIAELLAQGETEAELLAGYPRLTAAMVRLAPIYAAAYPRRGRPRAQPWHGDAPAGVNRRSLATIS